jgi:hypothetical protein
MTSRPLTDLRRPLAAGALAVTLIAAGCGGSNHASSSSSSAGSGSTTKANAPNPNTPEVSPSGDIPDNQAYVAYTPGGAPYSVKVPEGWSRSSTPATTTFTDKLNTITMESRSAQGALTAQQARSAEVPKLAQANKGFQLGSVSTVHRKSGDAVRIAYTAAGTPNAVTGKAVTTAVERYTFFHNGRQLLLTLSAPKGADNVDPWRIVTDSVRWSR